jgi:hypothetical protein
MLETNVRIVHPGPSLYVFTRQAALSGPSLTADLVEKACSKLRGRHGLAAVPHPDKPATLLVASREPIKPTHLESDEWELNVTDTGGPAERLLLTSPYGAVALPTIIERALLIQVETRTDFWRLNDSPRIWYEANPFRIDDGIAAYRRYEIGSILIDDIGVGLVVDVGTAFFSAETLTYFFDPNIAQDEQKQRESAFKHLTRRQVGQKGTLVYDSGRSKVKCYFADAPPGMTCATTGTVRVKQQSYESLIAYYRAEVPQLPVQGSTPAVRVSFSGLEYPQPVAADRVRVRIMNDNLPESLSDKDKISPDDRRRTLLQFWSRLEPKPLGDVAPRLKAGFWQPDQRHIIQFVMPPLIFGGNQVLDAPQYPAERSYRDHYLKRLKHLKRYGCYRVPPNMTRTFYCVYSNQLEREIANQLATDLVAILSDLTNKEMTAQLVGYNTVSHAAEQLRRADQAGMVVFILNEEPAAYHEAAFQLPNWRIKRVTTDALSSHYGYLTRGAWDRNVQSVTREKGQKRWQGFINLIALDVVQLLDVVPYRIDRAGPYDAQLIVDVGYDWRHFALSLLIARESDRTPDFRIVSHVYPKVDRQQESVNPRILSDAILDLFDRCFPRKFDPIESLLIIRDGRIVHQEPQGLDSAINQLKDKKYLSQNVKVDRVEVHKDTLKSIRVWDVDSDQSADNPLLGIGIRLNSKAIAVATTGAPTLTQGTAEPILLVGNGHSDVLDAARANFAGAQLNWSSPNVAQRLHIGMKRTDDDLKARDAQEIRRLR